MLLNGFDYLIVLFFATFLHFSHMMVVIRLHVELKLEIKSVTSVEREQKSKQGQKEKN